MPSRSRRGSPEITLAVLALVVTGSVGGQCDPGADAAARIGSGMCFEKTGRVILELGGEGSFDECNAKYPCVLKVGTQWWMWYNGRAGDCFTGGIGLARSEDGLIWTKHTGGQPVFTTGPPGACDATKVDHPAVVRFGGQFHMWYTAGDPKSTYRVAYATSVDGVSWTRQNAGRPVLDLGKPGAFDSKLVLHPAVLRDDRGVLHMWYNGAGPQRDFHVGYATSRDGVSWQRQNGGKAVLKPALLEGRREDYVYNVMVLSEAGRFHMWYSAALNLRSGQLTPRANAIVYASSSDGVTWQRDRSATLFNGEPGSIDEYCCFAPYVVRRGRELWMYYSIGHLVNAGDRRRFRTSLAIHRPR